MFLLRFVLWLSLTHSRVVLWNPLGASLCNCSSLQRGRMCVVSAASPSPPPFHTMWPVSTTCSHFYFDWLLFYPPLLMCFLEHPSTDGQVVVDRCLRRLWLWLHWFREYIRPKYWNIIFCMFKKTTKNKSKDYMEHLRNTAFVKDLTVMSKSKVKVSLAQPDFITRHQRQRGTCSLTVCNQIVFMFVSM